MEKQKYYSSPSKVHVIQDLKDNIHPREMATEQHVRWKHLELL